MRPTTTILTSAVPDATADGPPVTEGTTIEVSDTQGHLQVDPVALADLVARVLAEEGVTRAELSIALVDDATIRLLNERHLGHDWPTDVISFRLSDDDDPVLAGELVVSAERAATTARAAGVDPWAELALYVVHGLLHFRGHDDLAAADAEAMRRREGEILARLGLPNTFPLTGPAGGADRESARWSN